ncbi:DUF397 domain-containing protein [Plantactinospora sp. CA-290183]|uniref:DUF397 domain-containing protein n=1 Tax=Plantactinospora sp. CA-290183 TaxID=3240006 RepID=UPI003D8C3478
MSVDLSRAGWRRSSFSNGQGNCVEVAETSIGVGVRDSKDVAGPTLVFDRSAWAALIAEVKDGRPGC